MRHRLSILLLLMVLLFGSWTAASFAQDGTPTLVPSPTVGIPATNTRRPTSTPAASPSPSPSPMRTIISTLIPGPFGGDAITWTPLPPGPRLADHFVFRRPISDSYSNYWARNYAYGSTDSNTRPVHHGIDLQNETGTPVLAAGDGTVFHAGDDKTALFGPQPDFYGTAVVIEHDVKDATGQTVYTLYGHLSRVEVSKGQRVKAGQEIGAVGSTGVAIGPHLHFEVRIGNPNDYNETLNPELWIIPYGGSGVLMGKVTDLRGIRLPGLRVELQSPTLYRFAFSYGDSTVNGDGNFRENFVIPDVPEGYYNVFVKLDNGSTRFRTLVYIHPGRTNWLDIPIAL
ncbi:MAG: peptidoglycan DD-metalloendopeptidase family protein [Anaerolineae bacterium]|nr:peptidoglycan DD-metalloendopeptidase family protein [Anaerolineae bacterium]